MIFNIYVWKLTEGDEQLIQKIITSVASDAEWKTIELSSSANLKNCYPSDKKPIDICFGVRAYNFVKNNNQNTIIQLPLVSQLYPTEANKEFREQAWSELLKINERANVIKEDLEVELSPEDLYDFLKAKLSKLDSSSSFVGITRMGKKVLIADKVQDTKTSYNFQMSFEQLYAAELATRLLNLSSLTIVKENKNDRKED